MLKQIQNYINLLILCLSVSNFAFSQIEGCTDPEAYNCEDDVMMVDMHGNEFPNYIFPVGDIMYDNSCNWDWNLGAGTLEYVGGCDYDPDDLPDDFANPDNCQGYFNDTANECRYYQSPHGSEVVFNLTQTPIPAINVNWSTFSPPANATLVSYHVQRCVGSGCIWIADFAMTDENTGTFFTDNYDFEMNDEIKYAIAVKYSNNPYWGWAIGASYIYPPEPGNINGDGNFNVLDIVALANCVLEQNCENMTYSYACDMNGDGDFNVLDIVALANCVLAQNC